MRRLVSLGGTLVLIAGWWWFTNAPDSTPEVVAVDELSPAVSEPTADSAEAVAVLDIADHRRAPDAGAEGVLPPGVLELQVLQPDQSPALNAEAWCEDGGRFPRGVRAGLQGWITMTPTSSCDLYVSTGRVRVSVDGTLSVDAGTVLQRRFVMPSPVHASGVVERRDGTRVPGVTVFGTGCDSERTNADGAFDLACYVSSTTIGLAEKQLRSRRWTGSVPDHNIRLVAAYGHSLTVRTLYERRFTPCARVHFWSADFEETFSTDRYGEATINWPKGFTHIEAVAMCRGQLLTASFDVDTGDIPQSLMAGRDVLRIDMTPHPGLRGRVVGPDGAPVVGARVVALSTSNARRAARGIPAGVSPEERATMSVLWLQSDDVSGFTNEDGSFSLVPADLNESGQYRIQVMGFGLKERDSPIFGSFMAPPMQITLEPIKR